MHRVDADISIEKFTDNGEHKNKAMPESIEETIFLFGSSLRCAGDDGKHHQYHHEEDCWFIRVHIYMFYCEEAPSSSSLSQAQGLAQGLLAFQSSYFRRSASTA